MSSSISGVGEKSPFFRPNITRNGKRISRNDRGFDYDRDSVYNNNNNNKTNKNKNNNNNNNNNTNDDEIQEHKSTIIGCSSNLINAIVGAGIVGIPYAIQESGFLPGIVLILFSGIVTEKSLRLLVETAKHSNVPSYETLMEACYGKYGFLFISINMFIIAYGAMLSYLMIIKDTFSTVLGIDETDVVQRRYILVIISIIPLLLSCQRDMADLAITSKMNVVLDFIIVLLSPGVIPIPSSSSSYDVLSSSSESSYLSSSSILFQIQYKTIFIGLGVLSFAFVCQHSAFIIAGSLTKPTKERWSKVTKLGVYSSVSLAMLMGICGYLGFSTSTTTTDTTTEENNGHPPHHSQRISGNILNSLPIDSNIANIARGLLGITMLFVYPMESFVARHSCVVLFFHGRQAHDGDDTSVLNRFDRRIIVTFILYLLAVIPAALCNDLGIVLAIVGSIGGSCLSYIGPGIVYI
ncbi:Aa_trans-domain-containing protein, partial [Fragilariopsis cylindrus CCMP1102]